jgi:hypothetical protein
MDFVLTPLRALVDPLVAVPRAVGERRWGVPLALACVLSAAAGAAVGVRLDTARLVIPRMQQSGELMKASEREVSERIEEARRVAIVGGVAKGVLALPLLVLGLAVALKVAAWLVGRKAAFADLFTVAALSTLPLAVLRAVELAAALRLDVVTPKMAEALVPTSLKHWGLAPGGPALERIAAAVDAINLWAALLLGLGFAAASKWSRARGVAFGLFLYVLFAAAFYVGLPGLMLEGGPPRGGR